MEQIHDNIFIENLSQNFLVIRNFVNNIDIKGYDDDRFKKLQNLAKNISLTPLIDFVGVLKGADMVENKFVPWHAYENFVLASGKEGEEALKEFAEGIYDVAKEINNKDMSKFSSFSASSREEVFSIISDNRILKISKSFEDLKRLLLDGKINQLTFNGLQYDLKVFSLEKENKITKERLKAKEDGIKQQEVELNQQKVELKVSEDWHKYFETRAKEIRQEIRLLNREIFLIFPGKVASLRLLIYFIPVFSGIVVLFIIVMDQKLNFVHYEFATSMILLISILSYHLKYALREINILKHMHSSYLHRAIVAKTFQSLNGHLAAGAGEIVVKEAALAMFKKETQGFLSKDQIEPSNTPLQEIVGIFKNK